MTYEVQLEFFEGPLDLLIHLITKDEIDIYDIPIARITEEYLEKIRTLEDMDLEVASEFLVMAATLISIKSQMLLPKENTETEKEEIDPREELVKHLLEYQKYQKAAENLSKRSRKVGNIVTRPVDEEKLQELYTSKETFFQVDLKDLVAAYKDILKKRSETIVKVPSKNKVSLKDKIKFVTNSLKKNPEGVEFESLFSKNVTVLEIVITFIAILELARLQKLKIVQEKPFSKIKILPWEEVL